MAGKGRYGAGGGFYGGGRGDFAEGAGATVYGGLNKFGGMSLAQHNSGSGAGGSARQPPICFRCGETGHYQRFCSAGQPGGSKN